MHTSRNLLFTTAAVLSFVASGAAQAGPEGGVVTGGSATITTSGKKTDIRQSSNKVILDWRSFDIGADEHTEFHQPSSSSIALNRINDTKASQIDGKLSANGNIMLINPNGVVFGAGAQVDVGSLTATTADIDNDDFMAGKMDFVKPGNTAGKIVNNGSITVKDAGLVNFVAPTVENNGVIVARLGKVQLAAAETFTIDMAGDGLIQVGVSAEDGAKIARNSGAIHAEGGYVAVTAAKARGLVDSLVDNSGVIEASSLTTRGGKIVLSADQGATRNSGVLKANGKTGGGEILVGGDYQGKGIVKNSRITDVTQGSVIEASATDAGDGGKIIVWSDEKTDVAGTLATRGGESSGKGGFVETSSKQLLTVGVDTSVAVGGVSGAGEWLIDPEDIVVSDSGNDGNPATSDIASATINGTLNGGGNVTITTSGVIAGNGDITFSSANINKSVTNNSATLTVQAHRNIWINNSTINSTSGNALNVVLNADRDANQDGAVRLQNATINTSGGYFVAGGGSGTLWGADGIKGTADDASSTGADRIAAYGNAALNDGVYIGGSSNIYTAMGDIVLNGNAHNDNALSSLNGIQIVSSSVIKTSSGNISLVGQGGNGNNASAAILLDNSRIETESGAIFVDGKAGNAVGGWDNQGVTLKNNVIESTGSGVVGSITINALGRPGVETHAMNILDGVRILSNSADINIITDADGANSYSAIGFWQGGIIESSGSGDIYIEQKLGTGWGAWFSPHSSGIDRIVSANGDVTLKISDLDLQAGDAVFAGGDLRLIPYQASSTIGLGGGAGTFNLSDQDLSYMNANGRLIIGDAAAGIGDVIITSWDYSSKDFSGVEVYGNDIDIGGMTMGAGNFMAYAKDNGVDYGDINLSSNITRGVNGVSMLDLRADRNIWNTNNAGIIATDANSDGDGNPATSADSLNVILNSDRNADQNGAIRLLNGTISTLGGYFVAGGGSGTVGGVNGILGDGDGTGADDVMAWGNTTYNRGVQFNGLNLSTAAGNIYIRGQGYSGGSLASLHGFHQSGGKITTTTGDVSIIGYAGDSSGDSLTGVYFDWSNGIETDGGDITIEGTSGTGSGNYSRGIQLIGTSTALLAKNGGSIHLTGVSDRTGLDAPDIRMQSGATLETRGGGDITIDAVDFRMSDSYIGGALATGDITFNADYLDFSGTGSIQTSGDIYVLPRTATQSIGLGGGVGDLQLSDWALNIINGTGRLIIGDSSDPLSSIDINSWDLSSKLFSVELYGNYIDVGGITLGAGDVLVSSKENGAGAGDVRLSGGITRAVAGTASMTVQADRNLTFTSGANISSTVGQLNFTADSDFNNSADGRIIYNAGSIDTNGGNLTFSDDIEVRNNANWNVRGGTFTSGGEIDIDDNTLVITADNAAIGGDIVGIAGSSLTLKPYDINRSIGLGGAAGGFNLSDAELSGITAGHLVIGDSVSGNGDIAIQSWSLAGKTYDVELYGRDMDINGMTMGAGDITMIAGRDVSVSGTIGNSGAGGDLYIDVGRNFVNSAGAGAITMGAGGRYLVYLDALSNITRGGLTTGNLFGRSFAANNPASISTAFGNRFVFAQTPTLTVRANDVTIGTHDPLYNSFTYTLSGLATGDTAGSALSGAPGYATSMLTPTTYQVTPSAGTLTSLLGYSIAYQNGVLTMPAAYVPPPVATPVAPAEAILPPSVEHQIQLPQIVFAQGNAGINAAGSGTNSTLETMPIQNNIEGFQVNTSEIDSLVRMIEGGYLQIEQPVLNYYGLSQYEEGQSF